MQFCTTINVLFIYKLFTIISRLSLYVKENVLFFYSVTYFHVKWNIWAGFVIEMLDCSKSLRMIYSLKEGEAAKIFILQADAE